MFALRARLRPTRPFAFSTTVAARNEPDFSGFNELSTILTEQAEKTPPLTDKGKDKAQLQGTNRPVHEYRPIQPYSFIRPYDLSLDGRSWKDRPSGRPRQIPPSTREARKQDVFYQLGIDPLRFAQHPAVLSQFISEMAMIHPRRTTGLTTKSQRRVAKAIRRAKMMGVIPLHSRYPKYGMQW